MDNYFSTNHIQYSLFGQMHRVLAAQKSQDLMTMHLFVIGLTNERCRSIAPMTDGLNRQRSPYYKRMVII